MRRLRAGWLQARSGAYGREGGPVSSHPEGLLGGNLAPRVGVTEMFPRGEVRWRNGGLCLIEAAVKNLNLPKEWSGLCPWFLGSDRKAFGTSCLIGVCWS